ncbi:MAG: DDE-type integrase/transposase/recombinase [Dehalococcoidia bacterium]
MHVAVDDHSRLAYVEVLPSDRREHALAFLGRALGWYRERGVTVQAVMTDNGPAYRSRAWRERCTELGLRHLRTRPYRPQTNGKAERFIQTLLRSWAYAFAYPTSEHRTRALAGWLRWYNKTQTPTAYSEANHRSAASHTSVVTTASYHT